MKAKKRIIIALFLLCVCLMLNGQTIAKKQNWRIHGGLTMSNVYGDDVKAKKDAEHKFDPIFSGGGGVSFVGLPQFNVEHFIVYFDIGTRFINRGFIEKFPEGDPTPTKTTYISSFDILGRLHYGMEVLSIFVGSGIAIVPFTEYYNEINIPLTFGTEFKLQPNWSLFIEGDVILEDFPKKGVYSDFEKVNSISWLFGLGYLF